LRHEKRAIDIRSGERRLPACSVRQLAERSPDRSNKCEQALAAGCRQQQAGSLCSPEMNASIIRNGRIIDPANKRDEVADLYIEDGKIVGSKSAIRNQSQSGSDQSEIEEIDASNLIVAPGLIDMHVHLREPGFSHKETIESGARAAAAGGFTTIVAMPNTAPAADNPGTIAWIKDRAADCSCVNILPAGAISKNLAGEELAPLGSLAQAGVVALTDDGHCIQNHELMRRAVEYARMVDLPVLDHCQDYDLVGNGVVHEGYWSTLLGLPGWPAAGEEAMVMRNILLAELCDHHIHCQHMSSAGSVRLLREARARGVKISGEVCPHHIAMTDDAIQNFDSNCKMNPPLRSQGDIDALLKGIADGTLSILASDHAPHAAFEKEVEFDHAPFGIVGLETELGLFLNLLVHKHQTIDISRLVEMYTVAPARLLKINRGTLSIGAPADITFINPALEWMVDADKFQSASRNSPFQGWKLKGRAVRTIVGGKTVWEL
jgi:dihydroorotase